MNNKNFIKETNGITLIALIITVIILLILAGTAISIAVNGGDLFGKAQNAVEGYNRKVSEENTVTDYYKALLDQYAGGGNEGALPEGWYADAVAIAYPSATAAQKAPIPKGFTVSSVSTENTIANGLVIYEGSEAVTDDNHENVMQNRNQYVWIPVADINDMVMCKSRTDESECNIGFDENGVLKCKNSAHSETATDLCGRLYNENIDWDNPTVTDGKSFYSGSMATIKTGQTWDTSGFHEPALVTDYDENTTAAQEQIESDFYSMAESVAVYGGFYVARYEVQANAGSKADKDVVTGATNDQLWYGLYGTLRKQIKNGTTTTLVGQMIWGSQYDQVIKFIGEDAQEGHNYQKIAVAKSGANSSDNLKNIFDLEGNLFEWTAEANSSDYCAFRGGDFALAGYGYFYPASNRYYDGPNDTSSDLSSRQSLYVPLKAGSDSLEGAGNIIYDP